MIAPRDIPAHKIAGGAIVLVLHVLIAVFLIHAIHVARQASPAREMILNLSPPAPKPVPQARATASRIPAPAVRIPQLDLRQVPRYFDPNAKALLGLGQALMDCRPENIANLPPEKRAACETRGLKPNASLDYADHTNRARDAALWARQKARKNGPPLLPCASTQSIYATLSTATLACLANGAITGMDLDARPMYGDKPEEDVHVPNNGDPHPSYTDPDH